MGFILLVLSAGTLSLFIGGLVLLWVSKLFKIENASYKKSLIILLVSNVVSLVSGIVFNIFVGEFLSGVLVSVTALFVFHFFCKRYYLSTWKKSFGIYGVFWAMYAVIFIAVIVPIRLFVVTPFFVSGNTMSPAYSDGDYLLINKFNRRFSRGDVVVFFRDTEQSAVFLVKRIIGLPGETVEVRNGEVFINGQVFTDVYYNGQTIGNVSVVLGENQYFVLGDNRNSGIDSRSFGPIDVSDIEGKVFYKIPGL